MEWEAIGPPAQYRVGAVAFGGGDVMSGSEVERSEMVAVIRGGEGVDVGFPSRGGHRDPKMIECSAAADDRLAARPVGRAQDSFVVGEQVYRCLTHDPPPRLAVVQRRCSARQVDGLGDDFGVRGRSSHGYAPPVNFDPRGYHSAHQGHWSLSTPPLGPMAEAVGPVR